MTATNFEHPQFESCFGHQGTLRFASIDGLDADAQNVLQTIGLPINVEPYFLAAESPNLHVTRHGTAVRIGADYGSDSVVTHTGEVWSLLHDGRELYVNASLRAFITFLCIVAQDDAVSGEPGEHASQLRAAFDGWMRAQRAVPLLSGH